MQIGAMYAIPAPKPRSLTHAITGLVLLAVVLGAGAAGYKVWKARHAAKAEQGAITGTLSTSTQLGPSGLPVPRFVSLKTDKVNVRKGPSSEHALAFTYQEKGLPVEITAEFEGWRRVRDAEGAEGWILHNMLSGKRTALVAPGRKGSYLNLMNGPSVESGAAARLASGVVAEIKKCDGTWCRIIASGYDGYVDQNLVWGAYPGEAVN
jgi:SH3-like domain-containing protein